MQEQNTIEDMSNAERAPWRNAANQQSLPQASPELSDGGGIPSVNKGGSRASSRIAGIAMLGLVAAVIGFNVKNELTGDKQEKPKQRAEKVESKLPKLDAGALAPDAPAAPPPVVTAAATTPPGQATTTVPPLGAGANPQGKAVQPVQSGRPAQEWHDRKLSGVVLASDSGQGFARQAPAPSNATPVAPTPESSFNAQTSPYANQPGQGQGIAQQSRSNLGARLEPTTTRAAVATLLGDRNFLITKGTALDCALETALVSSLPGIATCRLTRDVFSDNGQVLLLERGSQLVGEYQGGVKTGEVRMFVLWNRVKTPNGVVASINSPGTDALGRTGLEGWVDNHFAQRFGAAILMSFIKDSVTALANASSRGGSAQTNIYGNTAMGGERVVEKILESTVNIPPTIVKNQGDHIQIMTARDIDFSSVYTLRMRGAQG